MKPAPGPADARGVARRFRREARRWDEIYSEQGSTAARLWDRWTRANVRQRFARTFAAMPDLRGKTVLDLGCGSGRYLAEALDRGAARVVGVDLAPEMLEIAGGLIAARGGTARAELRCVDLRQLELRERFDLVIANGLFDYLAPAGPMLERAAGWCSGVLVASFPDRKAPRSLPRQLYWRLRGVRITTFDRGTVVALASRAGFASFAVERLGPLHLLVARAATSGEARSSR